MTDPKPSAHAARAVRESSAQLDESRRIVERVDELTSQVRVILENNHFADKILAQIRGTG